MTRAPRSVLFVPASNVRHLEKVADLAADAVLVDLEDAVAPPEKDAAREHVRAAASRGTLGSRPFMLRVNGGPGGPPPADLTLVGYAKPSTVVLPKAEDAAAIRLLAARFAEHGATTGLMIESAQGVAHAAELAGCHPAVRMLILGSADLRLSLRAHPDPDRLWERHALAEVLVAARAHGAAAIDSVYFHYRDASGLRRHARVARELGYDGKCCIHPAQVAPIHEVYASTREERAWARRVLEAWRDGDGASRGIVAMDGEMIEALHVALAQRLLDEEPG